jgi:hypothetical protein
MGFATIAEPTRLNASSRRPSLYQAKASVPSKMAATAGVPFEKGAEMGGRLAGIPIARQPA